MCGVQCMYYKGGRVSCVMCSAAVDCATMAGYNVVRHPYCIIVPTIKGSSISKVVVLCDRFVM